MTIRAFVMPVVRCFSEHTDWDITVVCNYDPALEEELPAGVHYVPVSMKRGISLGGIVSTFKLYRLFREQKYDLVQYSTPNAAFYASLASRLAGIQHRKYHLMGFRYLGFTGLRKMIFRAVEKVTCALSTDIECVSKSNMSLGIEDSIFSAKKAHVISFGSSAGVDLTRFDINHKEAWRNELRQKLGYSANDCVFGYAGRITRDKGINELLDAFDSLMQEHNRLLLIGDVENSWGQDFGSAKKLEENPNVALHPFVDDIERYYAAMDVLVLPSYREGFGNIIIEAQAMGLPVIVTNIPGPVDAMEPGKTGLTVPVADSEKLAQAMEALSDSQELRMRLGTQGRQLVESRFDQVKLMELFLHDRKMLLRE